MNSNAVLEAILEGILLRGGSDERAPTSCAFWEREVIEPKRGAFFAEWEQAAEREKASRSLFAQHAFPLDQVVRARDAARAAVGAGYRRPPVRARRPRARNGATATERPDGAVDVEAREVPARGPRCRRARCRPHADPLRAAGEGRTASSGARTRSSDGLATHLIDTALDPLSPSVARRAGVIRTAGVTTRTTALLVASPLRPADPDAPRASGPRSPRRSGSSPSPAPRTRRPGSRIPTRPTALLDLVPAGNVLPEQADAALERGRRRARRSSVRRSSAWPPRGPPTS